MKAICLLGLTLLLTGCDQPDPAQSNGQPTQSIAQPSQSNAPNAAPSFGERLAESAAGGAAAGAAGGIGHAATSHALNRWSEKRAWKRKIESHKQYSYATHSSPPRRLMFRGRR